MGGGRERDEREEKEGRKVKGVLTVSSTHFDLMTLFADKEKLYPLSLNPN